MTKAHARRSRIRSHEVAVVDSFRRDRKLAAAYLDEVLTDGDQKELMLALRRLSEAFGGVSVLAQQAGLNPTTLYRTLSVDGNPELADATSAPSSLWACASLCPSLPEAWRMPTFAEGSVYPFRRTAERRAVIASHFFDQRRDGRTHVPATQQYRDRLAFVIFRDLAESGDRDPGRALHELTILAIQPA